MPVIFTQVCYNRKFRFTGKLNSNFFYFYIFYNRETSILYEKLEKRM
jgi:hypothetical protein